MKTPVVIIIYHRPQMTVKVIDSLREVKPSQIFVIADGPKDKQDVEKCKKTRDLIKSIDWKCEIHKNYSLKNLGLRKRVVTGLDWVFSKVDRAIILEDDLVIDKSFYDFCENTLEKYKNDSKIISISGNNFLFGRHKIKYSYFFSRHIYSWGWATWRRAWKLYDDTMSDWPLVKSKNILSDIFEEWIELTYWNRIFDLTFERKINSWAYAWTYTAFINNKLTIVPSINLVSNVGIGQGATHTLIKSRVLNIPIERIDFPLKHPRVIRQDKKSDSIIERTLYVTPRNIAGLIARSL
jgi:hypothetical protein